MLSQSGSGMGHLGTTSDGDVAKLSMIKSRGKPATYCRAGSGLQRVGEEEVAAGSPGTQG